MVVFKYFVILNLIYITFALVKNILHKNCIQIYLLAIRI